LCPVHRVVAYLKASRVGKRLFSFSSSEFTRTLRRFLTLALAPNPAAFTLKAFRAGRATEMAAQGNSLGAILAAGEWKSAQFLRYVDTDMVEQKVLFERALESDSD